MRADPGKLCGYNPCKVAKCVTSPSAMCVSRFDCNPIFFNREGRIMKSCKGKKKKKPWNNFVCSSLTWHGFDGSIWVQEDESQIDKVDLYFHSFVT